MKKLNHSKSDTLLITVDKKISETLNCNLHSFKSNFLKKDYIIPKLTLLKKSQKQKTPFNSQDSLIKSTIIT